MNLWTIFLAVVGVVQLVGLAFLVAGMRRAPEGFQDQTGFHQGNETGIPAANPAMINPPEAQHGETFGHAA